MVDRLSPAPPIDSSLAGVVVAETTIAWVNPIRGAFVHGYPLAELAEQQPYESVAHLVFRGELPSNPRAFIDELTNEGRLSKDRADVAAALGKTLGPEAALVSAMPLAGDDASIKSTYDLTRILARLPALCAAVRGAPIRGASYAERCLHALGATRTNPASLRALEVLLSLEAEHGLSASTFACRVAASSGAAPAVALAAATATLSGPRHGGATADARALLLEVRARGAREVVTERRAKKLVFPGFGHRIYKGADPRLPPLRRAIEAMPDAPLRAAAEDLEAAVLDVFAPKVLRPNIDLWGAVLLDALGVAPEMYIASFALGVGCGWLAHYAEQAATQRLIRPESAYRGAAERIAPRS